MKSSSSLTTSVLLLLVLLSGALAAQESLRVTESTVPHVRFDASGRGQVVEPTPAPEMPLDPLVVRNYRGLRGVRMSEWAEAYWANPFCSPHHPYFDQGDPWRTCWDRFGPWP